MKETPQRTDPAPKPLSKEKPISVVMKFYLGETSNKVKENLFHVELKVREQKNEPPVAPRRGGELGVNCLLCTSKLSTCGMTYTNRNRRTQRTQRQIAQPFTISETVRRTLGFRLHAKLAKIADNIKRHTTPARHRMPELQTEAFFARFHHKFHFQKFPRTVAVIVSSLKTPRTQRQPTLATPEAGKH